MPLFANNPATRLKMLGWILHGVGTAPLLAGCIGMYCLLHLPLAEKEEACAARLVVVDELLSNSEEIQAEHSQFKESLEDTRNRPDTLRQRIPDIPRETAFLEQMTEAANAEGLEICDYRRGEVTVEGTHSQLEVHIQCEGSYPMICRFLDRLARLPRICTIDVVTINAKSGVETYLVDLTLHLYFGVRERPVGQRKVKLG